jgi:tetratricopeptide (TPR) repeat protein
MIGQTVSHYKILEKLGEGGMGVVYKAQDLKLKRVVALKFLPKAKLGSERDRTRFLHEAQAAAALDHANICTVHEIVDAGDQTFIVMNYIAGRTLRQVIDDGPLEFGAAIDYAIQIAEGLKAAHEKNIIHRDIKSANVMLTNVGGAKITDFGLARLPDRTRVTRDEATVGTASYMSPERIEGGEVDQQSDIWSLGVILYEMIAGRLPFRREHESAVMYAIVNEEHAPVSSVRPDTPTAIEQVISKTLAKSWEDRYHSADELLADLRRIQTAIREGKELPVEARAKARRRPRWRIAPRLVKSRVTWVVAAAAAAVVIAVVLLIPRADVPFGERDWVVIADFENLTGEEIFDRSLDVALAVSLDQSKYVNVFPRRRAEETLQRMKRVGIERIDEETAREIAVRDGVKILIVPTITGVGENYTLTGVIQHAETGENLRSHLVEAEGQSEVLSALDELAERIRGDLGETSESISQQGKPLEKVTTSSLAALKQFSLGFDKHQRGDFDEAQRHYQYAVERDSTFAIALGALGMLEFLHFDRTRGIDYLRRAADNAGDTTEPEAFSIRAAHAIAVEEDMEKAAQIYRMSVEAYPDASVNHNNLGTVYSMLGRPQEAANQYQEAIRAEPTMMIAYNGLVSEYLESLGRIDLALEWLRRQMAYEPQSPWPYYNLAYAYVGIDDPEQAVAALERSLEYDPEFVEGIELLGHTLRLLGRYDESLATFGRLLEADPDAVEPHYYMGIVYELKGDKRRAGDYYDRCRRIMQWRAEDNPDDAIYLIEFAIVLTRIGQHSGARVAAEKAAGIDTTAFLEWARFRSVRGEAEKSLGQLEQALARGFRDLIILKYHPDFQPLHTDPRFADLLKRYLKT